MKNDDAVKRARQALQVIPQGRAITPIDKAKVDDLLARARAATSNPPPAVIAEKPRAIAKTEPRPSPAKERERSVAHPPPAKINQPQAPAACEPHQGEASAQNGPGSGSPTVIVNVTTAAPYPVYPPHPYWWWGAGCPVWSCPLRAGRPCRRLFCPY